ncbi:cytochrome P450 [Rhodococcus sp. NPDC059968]|uniref:cytochrome P450 n=1 Tax=Rhodococcus sp. NPDC059968 TaxID=3347017 RepID=UPI00366D05EA
MSATDPTHMHLPLLRLDDPDTWQDLHGHLAQARAASPFAVTESGLKMAVRHAEVESVLRSDAFEFGDLIAAVGTTSGTFYDWWHQTISSYNPPDHTRLRRLLGGAFTPKRVNPLRVIIQQITDEALGVCLDRGTMDISDFAHVLPMRVMATLLGIPSGDHARYEELTILVGAGFSHATAGNPELLGRVNAAVTELYQYSREVVARKHREPGPDLISALIEEHDGVDRLTDDEVVNHIIFMLFAGHDTTRGALSIASMLLATHPDQMQLIRDDPTRARDAVDEVMRYESTVTFTTRQPVKDIEISGVHLPKGVPVGVCIASAARDTEGMPDAGTFDILRKEKRAISFGSGIHFCLGTNLARAEIEIAIQSLATRTSDIALEGDPNWHPFKNVRGFDSLPLTLKAS